jgi:hypothetical protein
MVRQKSFGGRPGRKPKPGTKVHLGLRVAPELKQRIEKAAKHSTRSMSQEVEMRLDRAFREEDVFGGAGVHSVAMLMTAAFALPGQRRAKEKGLKDDWVNDAECYLAGIAEVIAQLIHSFPSELQPFHRGAIEGVVVTAFKQKEERNAR